MRHAKPIEDQFRVWLHDRPIGRIHRRGDYTRFVFDPEYGSDPRRAVLGLRFEDNMLARHTANMRLPPWFSNLLPEGRLRELIGRARGVTVEREMELLAEVGHDLPGAVRVLPEDTPVAVDLSELDELPQLGGLPPQLWRFSLAGVALKFSLLRQGDRFTAPAVGRGGDWIVKLPHPEYDEVPRNEFAMMTLGRLAGLEVPEVKLVHRDELVRLPDALWPRGEEYAYAVRRFDRGPNRELIHIEDMAQIRGFYPDDKYKGSFETVGALVYRGRFTDALREFARRLAINVLIGNGDAHLKNWSLIYRDPRLPTLSPAYDLVATAVYRPAVLGKEDLGLRFGHDRRFETVTLTSFAALEGKLGSKAGLPDVVTSFARSVAEALPAAAELLADQDRLRRGIERWVIERLGTLTGRGSLGGL